MKDYLEKYCQGHIFQQLDSDGNVFNIRLPAEIAAKLDDLLQNQTKSQGNCLFNQDLRKYCYGDYKRAKELVTALYEGFKEFP